jgi:hypothetical protein
MQRDKKTWEEFEEDLRGASRGGLALAALLAATVLSGAACGLTLIFRDLLGDQINPKIQIGGGDLPSPLGKPPMRISAGSRRLIVDNARKFCVPDGLPRVLANPYPFEIIQGPPGQTTIIYELSHQVRAIGMDQPLPEEELIAFPSFNGHSVGHFEGDTLVVETAGFNEKTFLDATGAPHTDETRTFERIRRVSPTQLEDVITIHDPEYYTRDWQARFVYTLRNDLRIEDYVCGEPHRDISSVVGVRRP